MMFYTILKVILVCLRNDFLRKTTLTLSALTITKNLKQIMFYFYYKTGRNVNRKSLGVESRDSCELVCKAVNLFVK